MKYPKIDISKTEFSMGFTAAYVQLWKGGSVLHFAVRRKVMNGRGQWKRRTNKEIKSEIKKRLTDLVNQLED